METKRCFFFVNKVPTTLDKAVHREFFTKTFAVLFLLIVIDEWVVSFVVEKLFLELLNKFLLISR